MGHVADMPHFYNHGEPSIICYQVDELYKAHITWLIK